MTIEVVELNDSALRLADENGILAQSPGFALVDGKIIHLGDVARPSNRPGLSPPAVSTSTGTN